MELAQKQDKSPSTALEGFTSNHPFRDLNLSKFQQDFRFHHAGMGSAFTTGKHPYRLGGFCPQVENQRPFCLEIESEYAKVAVVLAA